MTNHLLASCYFLPPVKPQGSFNIAGTGNVQKIRIGKALAHDLVAQFGVCRRFLEMSQELLAAKDEIISLLRPAHNPPNQH